MILTQKLKQNKKAEFQGKEDCIVYVYKVEGCYFLHFEQSSSPIRTCIVPFINSRNITLFAYDNEKLFAFYECETNSIIEDDKKI